MRAGTASALANREIAAAAVAESARRGYVDGRALEGVFTWLRPNDLVWNYVVNNYLLGKEPPAFDVLYWNQDTVRLSAGLHRDFIRLSLENSLTRPGALEVLGSRSTRGGRRRQLVVAARRTHHPWENASRARSCSAAIALRALHQRAHPGLVPAGGRSPRSYGSRAQPPSPERGPSRPPRCPQLGPDYDHLAARSGQLKPAPGGSQRPPQGAGQGARHLRPRELRKER